MVTPTPAIDYTDKDFRSLREALLRLARQRLPEWTDQSPADLGMLMIDLFAYVGDIALYYQDRIASELFPTTATERASVVDLLRLIGYELSPSTPATADLALAFALPATAQTVSVPHGARFTTQPKQGAPAEFVYLGPRLDLALLSDQMRRGVDADGTPVAIYDGLPVEQGHVVEPVVIGSSTGAPDQSFPLPDQAVVVDSVVIEVDEGAGWVTWERRESLLFDIAPDGRVVFSHPQARIYQLVFDGAAGAHVVFGAGRQPPVGTNNIRAGYRTCKGAAGNVAAATISAALSSPPVPLLRSVVNPVGAAGGGDAERADHAIRYAPFAFRSADRAVTESDYVALAQRTGTVAKVRARSRGWNQIDLYVAPAAEVYRPVPEGLRNRLLGYFEDKRMAGTQLRVLDASPVPVDITVELVVDQRFVADAVVAGVDKAVRALLAFDRVDFGLTLFQSDVFAAAESVEGVLGASVTRFRRADLPAPDVEAELARYNLPPLAQLPSFLRTAVSVDVAGEGRIECGEFEIPVPGSIGVTVRTGP
ncbi:baseplate J/gp47 family protein [Streptomyces melanogenes]|uniref:baseplate J/gp47 family protein n=1 Tax=Streptomyces melanogenes TaxID=67326 RepID=UPI0037B614B0